LLHQKRRRDDAEPRQEKDKDGRLEDQPRRQDDRTGEREVLIGLDHLLELTPRFQEEGARTRQQNAIPEVSAGDEEQRREDDEGRRVALFLLVESGRDEEPRLQQDDGRRQEDAT